MGAAPPGKRIFLERCGAQCGHERAHPGAPSSNRARQIAAILLPGPACGTRSASAANQKYQRGSDRLGNWLFGWCNAPYAAEAKARTRCTRDSFTPPMSLDRSLARLKLPLSVLAWVRG